MIQIETAKASGTTPALFGVEISENVCGGFAASTTPTAVVTVTSSGSPIAAGGVTMQDFTFAVTLTYQPCGMSSETKVKTFAETVRVSLPGTLTSIAGTVGTVTVQAVKICNNRAKGVKLLTSLSVAYS